MQHLHSTDPNQVTCAINRVYHADYPIRQHEPDHTRSRRDLPSNVNMKYLHHQLGIDDLPCHTTKCSQRPGRRRAADTAIMGPGQLRARAEANQLNGCISKKHTYTSSHKRARSKYKYYNQNPGNYRTQLTVMSHPAN